MLGSIEYFEDLDDRFELDELRRLLDDLEELDFGGGQWLLEYDESSLEFELIELNTKLETGENEDFDDRFELRRLLDDLEDFGLGDGEDVLLPGE